jgi:hypothetical protein
MEGQIFDEGKLLLPNTLKECFPSAGTGRRARPLLLRLGGRYSTNGEGPGVAAREADRASFRLA